MRTARFAAAAFVALLLGGCTGGDQPQPRWVDSSTVNTSASPATGAVGGGADWPHGVVTTTFDQDNPILRVSDPRTGAQLLRVDLPKARKNYWDRMSFSADWSWVGWTTGKNPVVLHVAQLRDNRYVETGKWVLPGSKGSGR
ncbi:MAG TPA: hypothetical protein VFO77_12660, partial [Actinoplanes sp.]|nr:hypothetical protein [Actinoplanes sp.]